MIARRAVLFAEIMQVHADETRRVHWKRGKPGSDLVPAGRLLTRISRLVKMVGVLTGPLRPPDFIALPEKQKNEFEVECCDR